MLASATDADAETVSDSVSELPVDVRHLGPRKRPCQNGKPPISQGLVTGRDDSRLIQGCFKSLHRHQIQREIRDPLSASADFLSANALARYSSRFRTLAPWRFAVFVR